MENSALEIRMHKKIIEKLSQCLWQKYKKSSKLNGIYTEKDKKQVLHASTVTSKQKKMRLQWAKEKQ